MMLLGVQTHFSQGWNLSWLSKLAALGTINIRDSEPWSEVETHEGVYDYTSFPYVAVAAQDGVSSLMTFSGGNSLYDGGFAPYDAATDAAYAKYVVATIKNSHGEIKEIEIGNEINGSDFTVPSGVNKDHAYVNLLETVYDAVKVADPSVKVLLGSTNMIGTGFLDGLFKLGALNYCDGVCVHPYDSQPEAVGMELAGLKQDMALYGDVKPIYATEFGLQTSDATEDPDYMLKMVAEMGSEKVAAAYWYALVDESFFPNMGLFQTNGKPAPAAAAFRFIEHTLIPLGNPVKIDASVPNVDVYSYAGGTAVVMWGDARGVTFSGNPKFFNSSGYRIGAVNTLSMNPIVVTGDFTFKLGQSNVVADTLTGYNTSAWKYFARTSNGVLNAISMENGTWQSFIGSRWYQPLAINDDEVTPAGTGASPIFAVQRYTAPVAETVQVKGSWSVSAAGAGGLIQVLLDNKVIWSATDTGHLSLSDLTVKLRPGDTLDIAVGPSKTGLHDETTAEVQLFETAATASTISADTRTTVKAAARAVSTNGAELGTTTTAPSHRVATLVQAMASFGPGASLDVGPKALPGDAVASWLASARATVSHGHLF